MAEPFETIPEDLLRRIHLLEQELARTNQEVLILTLDLEKRVEERTAELLERDQELRAAHQLLENRIRARTAELAQANEALHHANEQLRAIIETAPVGIGILDLDGNIQMWNPAAECLFGWPSHEVLRSPPPMIPEEATEAFRAILERLRRGEQLEGLERRRSTKGGKHIDFSLWTAPLRNGLGAVEGTLVIMVDITAPKGLEEQLRQVQRMEAVGQLAGGIAHDFNNLLTIIIGYGRLLQNQLAETAKQHLEQILNAADRATSLTSQLLAFSRKQIANRTILNLNEIVGKTQEMLRRVLSERIELKAVLSADVGNVEADAGQIDQILLNLVINARDAMPQGGRISIETKNVAFDAHHEGADIAPGEYVLLAVSDTGLGMDEIVRRRVFEPFFTTKEAGKGTGLGLSMVYGIVKHSGGGIAVYSEPGKGSTFELYLPRVFQLQGSSPSENIVMHKLPRGSETVLLVEDDAAVRDLTRQILTAQGYTVLDCANGLDALERYQTHIAPVHLLLTDVVMPTLSGRELAKRLRPLYPEMKVLYMTGYTEEMAISQDIIEPDTHLIHKPFTPEAIATKVREVLRANSRNPSVLVVDDEEEIRALLKQVLEQNGYQVQEASEGRAALKAFDKHTFDLVITDLLMPGQEGIETIQALRNRSPKLKILAISGALAGDKYLRMAQGLGADATLPKPFSSESLLKAVADLLN